MHEEQPSRTRLQSCLAPDPQPLSQQSLCYALFRAVPPPQVRPSHAPRVATTLWFYGASREQKERILAEEQRRALKQSRSRRS